MVKKTGLTKKDTSNALNAIVDTVKGSLSKGEGVRLIGFGSFTVRHRAARKGRNPQTGKTMQISARNVPAFKAGKGLKEKVNK
ncbi:MAG: HU family DNA-binding protein [Acetilactobacillus jinshanensis]